MKHYKVVLERVDQENPGEMIHFVLPTQEPPTTIECINPVKLNDEEYKVVADKLTALENQIKTFLAETNENSGSEN